MTAIPGLPEEVMTIEVLRRDRDRLRYLSAYLLDARETDRWNLAKELNDHVFQSLAAIKLRLQALHGLHGLGADLQIAQITQVVESSLEKINSLSQELRPPHLDLLGLVATLKWYLQKETNDHKLTAQLIDKSNGVRLEWQLETVCFRVVQEAILNVLRHAKARNVIVELRQEKDRLSLNIQDDGKGFELERLENSNSFGLLGMEEAVTLLGGTFLVDSKMHCGTVIHVTFPLRLAAPRVRQRQRAKP